MIINIIKPWNLKILLYLYFLVIGKCDIYLFIYLFTRNDTKDT